MTSIVEATVREEVEALHRFFVGWFSGALPRSEFEAGFLRRFDLDFVLIPPTGSLLTLDELADSLRTGHATRPEFRIAIRNVKVCRVTDEQILATYEEWQWNAPASTPARTARITTAVFKNVEPLQWLHVHESWMPVSGALGERRDSHGVR
ncbi:MAG: hypothetical protein ACC645_10015 [Pirellulales bacterium]